MVSAISTLSLRLWPKSLLEVALCVVGAIFVEDVTPGSALRDITNSTYSSKAVDSLKLPAITVSKPESRLRDRVSFQPRDITELLALPDDLLPDIESVPQALESDEFAGLPPIEDLEQVSGQCFVHDLSEEEPEDSVALDEALKRFIVDPGDFEWVFATSHPDEADLRPCYMFDDVPNRIECK